MIDNEISGEDFLTILKEEKKYQELNKIIRMMNSQRSDAEKLSWLKKVKKEVFMKLLSVMKLLKTVYNNTCKYKNEIILFKV